jgi:hypothetical protein
MLDQTVTPQSLPRNYLISNSLKSGYHFHIGNNIPLLGCMDLLSYVSYYFRYLYLYLIEISENKNRLKKS